LRAGFGLGSPHKEEAPARRPGVHEKEVDYNNNTTTRIASLSLPSLLLLASRHCRFYHCISPSRLYCCDRFAIAIVSSHLAVLGRLNRIASELSSHPPHSLVSSILFVCVSHVAFPCPSQFRLVYRGSPFYVSLFCLLLSFLQF
jgi:hypothetical protein